MALRRLVTNYGLRKSGSELGSDGGSDSIFLSPAMRSPLRNLFGPKVAPEEREPQQMCPLDHPVC